MSPANVSVWGPAVSMAKEIDVEVKEELLIGVKLVPITAPSIFASITLPPVAPRPSS